MTTVNKPLYIDFIFIIWFKMNIIDNRSNHSIGIQCGDNCEVLLISVIPRFVAIIRIGAISDSIASFNNGKH